MDGATTVDNSMSTNDPAPMLDLNTRPLGLPAWPTRTQSEDAVEVIAEGLYGVTVTRLLDLIEAHCGEDGRQMSSGLTEMLYRAAPFFLEAGIREQRDNE